VHNFNKNITLRVLTEADFYPGLLLQAFGNRDTIYRILIKDGQFFYSPVFKINNGKYEEVIPEFQAQYTRGVSHLQNWCETIWTSPLNREKKLNQLGI
jgi:hypothetical protein